MTVKEVEEQLHITRANVRFYEKEGLLSAKRNPINGYRDYSHENIETIRRIVFLRNLDVSIEDIRKLQEGKAKLSDVLEKQITRLEKKRSWASGSIEICEQMLRAGETSLEGVWPERYEQETGQTSENLIRDSLSALAQVKDVWIPWLIILISVLTAVISYPLLPQNVATDWEEMIIVSSAGKWIVFLFPAIEILVVRLVKEGGFRMLRYENFGPYTVYVHDTAKYVTAFMVFIPFSWQMYIILFQSGVRFSVDRVLVIEIVVFLLGFWAVVLYQKRKYRRS
ncbi:MerR family transcriptional regulator [Hespellia stercorisuis]|uniref:DNA-binding transcriptional regulator, MerR family n=1 Tax=Hespellia stercorisuis DSM 15480 TaxID=1121950 RepID=A0A1M6QB99_9FIRM|nr:MerR family transcriptional regulator [Hespellia stercorisuis]SHK17522.1 DNA-binding transcriptional regulator, MerR family [Hespellia stercorisuis DSM 15480]